MARIEQGRLKGPIYYTLEAKVGAGWVGIEGREQQGHGRRQINQAYKIMIITDCQYHSLNQQVNGI